MKKYLPLVVVLIALLVCIVGIVKVFSDCYRINKPAYYVYKIESNNEGHFLVVRYTRQLFGGLSWRFSCPPEQPTIEAARIYRDGLSNHWSAYKIVE